jgi:protein-disulfide isomerase
VIAAVVVAVLAVVSSGGAAATTGKAIDAKAATGLFDGIPQQGATLGDPDAPVTLVEYADLRCPVCRDFTLNTLPTLIRDDVRTGKLRIELKLQTFVGQQYAPGDSERAARFAHAAAAQNRLWPFVDAFYRNQGPETEAYVTDAFLRRLSAAVPGLDATKALGELDAGPVNRAIAADAAAFTKAGFDGTPSFELGRTGGTLAPLRVPSLDAAAFTGPIDALLS